MKTKSRLIISALLMCALIGSGIFLIYNIAGAPGAPPYYARGAEAMPISFDIYTPSPGGEEEPYEAQPIFEVLPSEFRGVWVTTVINLDFPTAPGISAEAMKQEIDEIVARTVELGLNTIIFQVRPTGDAFYESDIFPWSHWLSGTQGVGISDFDPLAYWIEVSHANNLELHAWINPYRIIHTITNSSDPNTLYENHPVRLRPELAVGWTDNNGRSGLFLDPGLPEARQLIIDGIENLIRNYAVDGIHFDDYFYPDTNFDDAASFERYGDGMDLHYWRRENVNTLVRDIQSKIRSLNEELDRDVTWGISPTAIWKNETSHPLGVPTTRGMESFHALYADTRLWVTDEMVDYIMPQIYWYIGFAIADFEAVFTWWEDLCRDSDVDLIIGHAAWREEDNHGPNWQGEMVRQMQMVTDSDVAQGSVFFRSNHLRGAVGDAIRDFYFDLDDTMVIREPVIILDTLSIGTPANNATIEAELTATRGFNITGTSDPNERLFVNGNLVRDRTVEGFFFVHVPVAPGVNEFTFTQEGQTPVTRTITRNLPTPPPPPTPAPTVTQVTAPRYATVSADAAWVFPRNTLSGGSDWKLVRGQRDRITAESTNGFFRLSGGMWIRRDDVTHATAEGFTNDVLGAGQYRIGGLYDVIAWSSSVFPAIYAELDGRYLRVSFGMHTSPPPIEFPADLSGAMIESATSGIDGGIPYHLLRIRDDVSLEGYYVEFEDGEVRLRLRRRRPVTPGDMPLEGFTFVLDAGHGGDDLGAIGPMGRSMPESYIVLINTFKLAERLEELGATIYLTRDSDATVSLSDRVALSRQVKPDLFLSLHINSVEHTTNARNIRGFTVWYRNQSSAPFSRIALDMMYYINPGTNRHRGINQANFYVCRPTWAPHVLLESSFIVNIEDFAWLIDPIKQAEMADATVDTILEYFSQ